MNNEQPSNGGNETNRFVIDQAIGNVEPWPEPVNGQKLLDELREVLTRFVVLPRWAAETLSLWVLHTYIIPSHLSEERTMNLGWFAHGRTCEYMGTCRACVAGRSGRSPG